MAPDDLGLLAYNACCATNHAAWPTQVQEPGRAMWRRVGVAVDKASRRDERVAILDGLLALPAGYGWEQPIVLVKKREKETA
jgi:hypothetical protein